MTAAAVINKRIKRTDTELPLHAGAARHFQSPADLRTNFPRSSISMSATLPLNFTDFNEEAI
jgi:hypothetical protein